MGDEGLAALRRGTAVTGHVQVASGPPAGPGWTPLRDLATKDMVELVRRAVPDAPETVAAALFASSVAGALAAPLTGALLTERRAVAPDQLWVRPAFTGVDAIAVGSAAVTVLPGDPLAAHPGVATAADLDQLRRAVLTGFRAPLVPLLHEVAATTRRGRRALWADAGDRLATCLLLAGRASGDPDAGRAEAEALLALADPPLRHEVQWVEFPHRGARVLWKRRAVCCLIYQAPSWRGQFCATCPLVPESETVERTRAWLG